MWWEVANRLFQELDSLEQIATVLEKLDDEPIVDDATIARLIAGQKAEV